ncbi:Protein unc-45 like protein B [Nosema granulosis]|uniref:Protein unc-45 like protein B n=1 Tax=Nosema granulosis TaxID=83296 RepID=A0A9P6KYN2_9MICR|nr:Protein unc-45 like protein B [Nosema granulosis]
MNLPDWKTCGIFGAIFLILFFIIKKVFFSGEGDLKRQVNRLILDGIRYDKNKEYQTAIYFFKKAVSISKDPEVLKDAYFAIAGCYLSLKKYEESISFCNKSLEINLEDNLIALNMKYQCNAFLGRSKEYLQDLILFNSIRPNNINEKKIRELTESVCEKQTSQYCNENIISPSYIRYSEFFDTMIGILPIEEDDEIVYLIKHKKYEKLDEMFFRGDQSILKSIEQPKTKQSSKLFSHNLINACLYYLKGNYEKAIEILRSSPSEFDLLFVEFLKSTTKNHKQNNGIMQDINILQSTNPSIIFYISKIYYMTGDYDKYLEYILKLLDYPFAYADLLSFFEEKCDDTKFTDFAKEGILKYSSDNKILYICATYFLVNDKHELLNEVLSLMGENDCRKHFIKGLIHTNNDDLSAQHFMKAKELDPTYHNAYIFLANILMYKNEVECKEILSESLKIASCHDEAFVSIKLLLRIENQNYVRTILTSKSNKM